MIHAISTGRVKITKSWLEGKGSGIKRLINTLFDKEYSDWLPIWCYLIEDRNRLILVDTGISQATTVRRYFPPQTLLVERAVNFQLQPEEEIGHQIKTLEIYLEQELFLRANRKVILSDASNDLLETTNECLDVFANGLRR